MPRNVHAQIGSANSAQILGLLFFALIYAGILLPFDLLGGYLLPRRFGRAHPPFGRYLLGLARGITFHAAMFFLVAIAMMFAGRFGGMTATIAVGVAAMLLLLGGRVAIASLLASLKLTAREASSSGARHELPVVMAESPDEGFTGGVIGTFIPRFQILPDRWRQVLGTEGFQIVSRRRMVAVTSGSWRRGRFLALLFTVVGLIAAASLVPTSQLGTASGTIELSFWFTLWSFAGLLILPTFSR